MIAPLRRTHRWIFITLAVTLPTIFVLALMTRPPGPASGPIPEILLPKAPAPANVLLEREDLFAELPIRARFWQTNDGPLLELAPLEPVEQPDVLVYLSPSGASADRLPDDALLLGTFAGSRARAYPLPVTRGTLILYSLGHQQIVDHAALPDVAGLSQPATAASSAENAS